MRTLISSNSSLAIWFAAAGMLFVASEAAAQAQTHANAQSSAAGKIVSVAPFSLTTLDGSTVTISAKENAGITVVLLLGTE
jgi:hypothetical protein